MKGIIIAVHTSKSRALNEIVRLTFPASGKHLYYHLVGEKKSNKVEEYDCIFCTNMLTRRDCMLATSGNRREQKGREMVVLWKVTNRSFLVHCASGQPKEINKTGFRDKGQ